jgi:hypothetical protein
MATGMAWLLSVAMIGTMQVGHRLPRGKLTWPHRRLTLKPVHSFPTHSYDKYQDAPPYNGFGTRELPNAVPEETWQRPASRDHFESHHDAVTDESERKGIAKAASSSDSQPLALRNEDCSVFESGETNLDNDTVDFLTTLELE